MTATLVAAEFEVPLICDSSVAAAYIFKVLTAASAQITGWRRGRQLGLISFKAPAAEYDGAAFDGLVVSHKGWGFQAGRNTALCLQACRDACDFPPDLHV